jgi:hypothetical protein
MSKGLKLGIDVWTDDAELAARKWFDLTDHYGQDATLYTWKHKDKPYNLVLHNAMYNDELYNFLNVILESDEFDSNV